MWRETEERTVRLECVKGRAEQGKGLGRVQHSVAPKVAAGGSRPQATMMQEEWQSERCTEERGSTEGDDKQRVAGQDSFVQGRSIREVDWISGLTWKTLDSEERKNTGKICSVRRNNKGTTVRRVRGTSRKESVRAARSGRPAARRRCVE